MTLPVDYDTVAVRGGFVYLDGTPVPGYVTFTGKPITYSMGTHTFVLPTTIKVPLVNGLLAVNLPATDDPHMTPNGWTYFVEETFDKGGGRTYDIDVPLAAKEAGIDLDTVAPVPAAYGDPTAFITLSQYNALEQLVFTSGYEALPVTTGLSWTGAIDLTPLAGTARMIHATLTGNVTLTLPTPPATRSFTVSLLLTQDATGSRTLTIPAASLSSYGVDPVLSTAGGSKDVVHLMWTGLQWVALMGAMAVA